MGQNALSQRPQTAKAELRRPSSDRKALLLFWNPDCGFCQRMLPDVLQWEARFAAEGPAILVVSSVEPQALT